MKVLLLGVGMQGKAALYDLVQSNSVEKVIAADRSIDDLHDHVRSMGYGEKVDCEYVDVEDGGSLNDLFRRKPDVAVELMDERFQTIIARTAVENGVHLVNAFYVRPGLTELEEKARSSGVSILPKFGLDPGIDLVILGEAVRSFEKVEELFIYGAGIPEEKAATGPLRYKVTWTLRGVLQSYLRPARVIKDGIKVDIGGYDLFLPENLHEIDIDSFGKLEAFPDEDSLDYVADLGIDIDGLRNLGHYTLRWPGHGRLWRNLIELGLLDERPVEIDGAAVVPKLYLEKLLEPQVQYEENEKDLVILRVVVNGIRSGVRMRAVYQMVDSRDLGTGFSAMSRTVGFTASIGAQMIADGTISKRGVLSPVSDVPYNLFCRELESRGIRITSELTELR